MSFGGGNSLSQAVRLLIEVGGLTEGEALRSLMTDLRQIQRQTAEEMRDAKAPADEMIKVTANYERQINSLQKALSAYETETRKAGEATQEWADLQAKLAEMNGRATASTTDNTAAVKANNQAVLDAAKAASEATAEWDRLQAALGRMEKASQDAAQEAMRDSVTVTAASQRQYDAQVRAANKAADDQIKAADRAAKAQVKAIEATVIPLSSLQMSGIKLQDSLTQATTKAASGAGAASYKFLQMGQVLDDLQYVGSMGLRPIINNVMQIAPAVGIAMIGLEVLRKMFGEDLVDAMKKYVGITGETGNAIEDLQSKLKKLTEKAWKTEVDYGDIKEAEASLERLQKAKAAYDGGKETDVDKALADEAKKVVSGYSGGTVDIARIITAYEGAKGINRGGLTDKEKQLIKDLEAENSLSKSGLVEGVDVSANEERIRAMRAGAAERDANARKTEAGLFAAGDPGAIQAMQERARNMPGLFGRVGPDGKTLGQATLNLPSGTEAMARKMADERQAKLEDEREKEGFERINKQAEREKKLADAEQEALDYIEAEHDKAAQERLNLILKNTGEAADAENKAKEKAAKDEEAAKRKAEAERKKLEREAGKLAAENDLESFGVPIAREFPGLSVEQTAHFAKQAQGLAKGGMTDQAATQQVLERIFALMVKQNAMQEAQMGFMGPWTAKLQQLEAYQQQVEMMLRGNQQRGQNRRPALGPGRGVR